VTSLAASDVVTVTDNTNSTTTSTGAVVVSGGVGVAQDMVIGGSVTVNTSITSTGDINANANVLISTVPTEPTHATNKSYVDTRALALAVAMS
jgi:UDP-3-O-[3-hydroxymyristoyl] glucosamine N-acyltransferase